jgi:flagellar motor switch/type III secretory pathway protein FliN
MKTDSKELARESSANADQALRDPFAVDVFTSTSTSFEASPAILTVPPAEETKTRPINPSWNLRLPRIKPAQVEASAAIASLSLETYTEIYNSVINVLSRYSMNPPDQISVSLVDLHETDFLSEVAESNSPQPVFATFVTEPNATSISFELGARFAAMLVDRMLGGDGVPPDHLRSLTRTERAVIEFLCLSSASELHQQTGEPLLRLLSVSELPPWRTGRMQSSTMSGLSGEDWKRGLVASLRIGVGEISGIARAYLNVGALTALGEAQRRLRAAPQNSEIFPYTVTELARYASVSPDVGLSVLVGKTDLTPQELLELEPGDVMVVGWPSLRWRRRQISGPLLLRVGDADDAMITAEVSEIGDGKTVSDAAAEASQSEPLPAGSLKVKVGEVSVSPPSRYAERVKMEQEAAENAETAEGASLIEAVMLTVRVELAARRLRLDELSRLRANQILDLGCTATDPVDLIVDGRRIARGELVDIEGRLGVRITQVLV